jgi:hypothetical protein
MITQFYPHVTRLRLSSSSLDLFESCARKLEFRKFYRHSQRERSISAEAGIALHNGFQKWLTTQNEEAAIVEFMLSYPVDLDDGSVKNDRPLEACYAMLMAMIKSVKLGEYEIATIKCIDGIERPAIEVPFEIEIEGFVLNDDGGESPVLVSYIGYIDAILYHRIKQIFGVFDIKTHRDNSNDLTAKFAFDDQPMPYGIVLDNMLGGQLDNFEVSYISCYIDLLEPECRVYSFPKSKLDIEDWAKTFYHQLQQIKMFANMGWFPRRGSSCMNFRRPCQFFSICDSRRHETLQKMILGNQAPVTDQDNEFKPWVKFKLRLAA